MSFVVQVELQVGLKRPRLGTADNPSHGFKLNYRQDWNRIICTHPMTEIVQVELYVGLKCLCTNYDPIYLTRSNRTTRRIETKEDLSHKHPWYWFKSNYNRIEMTRRPTPTRTLTSSSRTISRIETSYLSRLEMHRLKFKSNYTQDWSRYWSMAVQSIIIVQVELQIGLNSRTWRCTEDKVVVADWGAAKSSRVMIADNLFTPQFF